LTYQIKTMTKKHIISELNSGVKFGNNNTDFHIYNGEYWMCEYSKNCKYTKFNTIEKFANRIIKFYKTGY